MTESRNVQIPLTLFKKIMMVFDYLIIKDHAFPSSCDVENIYSELCEKQLKLNIRTAYTNTILAKDDNQKGLAYANYNKLKNQRELY